MLCVHDIYIQRCRCAPKHTYIHVLMKTPMYVEVGNIMVCKQKFPDPNNHEKTPDNATERPRRLSNSCLLFVSFLFFLFLSWFNFIYGSEGSTFLVLEFCKVETRVLTSKVFSWPKPENHTFASLLGLEDRMICAHWQGINFWNTGDVETHRSTIIFFVIEVRWQFKWGETGPLIGNTKALTDCKQWVLMKADFN